jgi:hypothetical protein
LWVWFLMWISFRQIDKKHAYEDAARITPEERARSIAKYITRDPHDELENEIITAIREAYEDAAKIADDMEPDKCCGDIAAAIRARIT